jgi:hypothetical protein
MSGGAMLGNRYRLFISPLGCFADSHIFLFGTACKAAPAGEGGITPEGWDCFAEYARNDGLSGGAA